MIDITDRTHQPDMLEIGNYIDDPLFAELCSYMETACKALVSVEYSGDKILWGWNVRFRKGGRTLCRLYPRHGEFSLLIVIGRKEKERVEALLPQMSERMRQIYLNTQEGMGQRWLLVDLKDADDLYRDVLQLVDIRRTSA